MKDYLVSPVAMAAKKRFGTLADAARTIGVSNATMYRWTRGDLPARKESKRRIEDALGKGVIKRQQNWMEKNK